MRLAQKLHSQQEMEADRVKFYIRFAIIEEDKKRNKMTKIGINARRNKPIGFEPKQWEFECPCGHIWIDCQNTGCPMCGEEVGITAKPYDIKQPKEFSRK